METTARKTFFVFLIGSCLYLFGQYMKEKNHDLGEAISLFAVAITVDSFMKGCGELFSIQRRKNEFNKRMDEFDKRMDDKLSTLEERLIIRLQEKTNADMQKLLSSVGNYIEELKKLTALGLTNFSNGIDSEPMIRHMNETENKTVFFQRRYLSSNELTKLRHCIPNWITRKNHKVNIVLCMPAENIVKGTIDDNDALKIDAEFSLLRVKQQLNIFREIKKKLPSDMQENFQIKVASNIAEAITAYDNKIIYSPYLINEYADDGIQLEAKGDNTAFYGVLLAYSHTKWISAITYNSVDKKNNELPNVGQATAV